MAKTVRKKGTGTKKTTTNGVSKTRPKTSRGGK